MKSDLSILKKYIKKRYKIHDIYPLYPISNKHKTVFKNTEFFKIFDQEENKNKSEWSVSEELIKIFSVDAFSIKKVFSELLEEEISFLRKNKITK